MKRDEFIEQRWNFHRDRMDAPRPKHLGDQCHGKHGGDWDWWIWEGETYSSERTRCGSCKKIVMDGGIAPWRVKALADWKRTPEYKRRAMIGSTDRARRDNLSLKTRTHKKRAKISKSGRPYDDLFKW